MRPEELAKTLDLTILDADVTEADVVHACDLALEHHFAAVTGGAGFAGAIRTRLLGSDVKACAAIGMETGGIDQATALTAVRDAVAGGVEELDLLLSTEAMRHGRFAQARDELHTMIRSARACALGLGRGDLMVKIVVESPLLHEKLTRLACKIITDVQGDFAIAGSPAQAPRLRDVELLRECLPGHIGVGCAGVSDLESAEAMIAAGASRVGSGDAAAILQAFIERRAA